MTEIVGFSMILFIFGMGAMGSLIESKAGRFACVCMLGTSWLMLFGLVLQMPARG